MRAALDPPRGVCLCSRPMRHRILPACTGMFFSALSTAASAPAAAAASSTAGALPPADSAAEVGPGAVGTALAVVGLDLEIAGRRLSYSDLLSENLRRYEVLGVPMPSLRAEVYPLARGATPVLRDLGVELSCARALGLDSEGPDGSSVATSWNQLHAGLRGRFRPMGDAGPLLGASAGLRYTDFTFEANSELSSEVASVAYVAFRLGVDGRIAAGPVSVEGGAGYQAPLSMGQLASRFRASSAGGVDLRAAVAVPLPERFEARVGASYTRFFYDFNSEPGDVYIAGGALDQFFSAHVGVSYVY
jgi:hypothetical protein